MSPNIVNLSLGKAASIHNSGEHKNKILPTTAPLKQSTQTKVTSVHKSISTERKANDGNEKEALDKIISKIETKKNVEQKNHPSIPTLMNEKKGSQGSFYISEDDSQHTLTPVAHS